MYVSPRLAKLPPHRYNKLHKIISFSQGAELIEKQAAGSVITNHGSLHATIEPDMIIVGWLEMNDL